ncbi:MAG TPA: hypothetical protein P5257_11615 [Bacteroidales bacterium]|nr:hypothetical protein [Bacteroidales bacterium]HRR92363.1 hypothetical protein [Bacteroidales bacterium]HRT90751.1 hypothetical protein [Bacteroidales bacterium]
MKENDQPLDDIKTIKKIMEQSARFISLSGLSGISAGIIAIAGAVTARIIINGPVIHKWYYSPALDFTEDNRRTIILLLINAAAVLALAVSSAVWFSWRKAGRSGNRIWTPVTGRLLLNLSVPLLAGALFILLTPGRLDGGMIAAATIIFYGLGLVNAAKFTLGEIFWLGIMEIITGLACLVMPGWAFIFWVFGFGILHIAYGVFMYLKYKG